MALCELVELSSTYEVPTIVVERSNLCLEIDAALSLDNIMISKALVPWGFLEDTFLIHIHPCLLEAQDATRGKVDTAVVEVVPDSHKGAAVFQDTDLAYIGRSVDFYMVSRFRLDCRDYTHVAGQLHSQCTACRRGRSHSGPHWES